MKKLNYNNKKDKIKSIKEYKISYIYPENGLIFNKFFKGTKKELKYEIKKLNDKFNIYYEEV